MKVEVIKTGLRLFVECETETRDGTAAFKVSKIKGSRMTFVISKDAVRIIK